MDKAPGHLKNIVDFHPNVTVVYLHPSTTSFLQPMDQGIIAIFKRYYMKRTLWQAIAATGFDESFTLRDFWKGLNIYKAVHNIAVVWNEVQSMAINGVWKKLCPPFVNDFKGFDTAVVNKMMVAMTKELQMDLGEEDFTELFEKDIQPVTNEESMELHKQQNKGEEEQVKPKPCHFNIKKMQQAFAHIEKGLVMFADMDPNAQCFSKIIGACYETFTPYNIILEEKKSNVVQDTLDQFFPHIEPQRETSDVDPQPSTSAM